MVGICCCLSHPFLINIVSNTFLFPQSMYPYSDTDPDSDASYQSGDPDKYWWIRGDYPYGDPWADYEEEVTDDDEVQSEAQVVPDLNEEVDEYRELVNDLEADVVELRAQVATLRERDIAREALLHIQQQELHRADEELAITEASKLELAEKLTRAEAELAISETSKKDLAQRVSELATFLCGTWADHASDTLRIKQLLRERGINRWIIVLLMGVIARLAGGK